MKDELMRRISAALDSPDGLAGDPALQEELRADPANAKYAKDLTRVGKWLATWPLPEPDDGAFEALAARIEQRLDEPVGTSGQDLTEPPAFDDDDALRDATVGLLQSGEYRVSDSSIEILSDSALVLPAATPPSPSETSKPVSPIAKVTLGKARVPAIVEESSGTGEPLSAADLELRLEARSDPGKPKKKIGPASPDAPAKKKKKKAGSASAEGDRISIPTPKPSLSAPTLSPVVHLPRADERKPAATFWWFAAAATIGLGVFGAATLFESAGAPASETAYGSTLVTTGTLAPTAAATPVVLAPPATAAAMPTTPAADVAPVVEMARLGAPSIEAEEATEAERARAPAPRSAGGTPYAPARVAEGGATTRATTTAAATDDPRGAGAGGRAPSPTTGDDMLAAHHAVAGPTEPSMPETATPSGRTAATAPPATTATPTPAPPPPADMGDLADSPDRSTIQAVLAARLEAVTACANGAHGLADVDIVISGSGRITTATVNGSFAGTPVGSCIARAVRGATFPPFSQPRFEVTYPYHL